MSRTHDVRSQIENGRSTPEPREPGARNRRDPTIDAHVEKDVRLSRDYLRSQRRGEDTGRSATDDGHVDTPRADNRRRRQQIRAVVLERHRDVERKAHLRRRIENTEQRIPPETRHGASGEEVIRLELIHAHPVAMLEKVVTVPEIRRREHEEVLSCAAATSDEIAATLGQVYTVERDFRASRQEDETAAAPRTPEARVSSRKLSERGPA